MQVKQVGCLMVCLLFLGEVPGWSAEQKAQSEPIGKIGIISYSQSLGMPKGQGISQVLPGSPADEAGLQMDDTLLAINGKTLEKVEPFEVFDLLKGPIGSEVTLQVLRAGEKEPVELKLTRRDTTPLKPKNGSLGIWLGWGYKDWQTIREVIPKSPAARAKLESGDVILLVDGKALQPELGWKRFRPLQGSIGSPVTLTVRKKSTGQEDRIKLVRVNNNTYIENPVLSQEEVSKPERVHHNTSNETPVETPALRPEPRKPGFVGLTALKVNQDAVVVNTYAKNSPALLAGIQIGDEILRINDQELQDLPDKTIAAMLEGQLGDQIKVAWRQKKDGKTRELVLTTVPRNEVVDAWIAELKKMQNVKTLTRPF